MVKLKSINLIHRDALKKTFLKQVLILCQSSKGLRPLVVISVIVFLIIIARLILTAMFKEDLAGLKQIMQQTKVRLEKAQSQSLELEKIKSGMLKQDVSQKQRLDFLESTSSRNKKYSKLLVDISNLTPQDLWINRCVLAENEIRITGSTLENQLITQFMDKLDRSGFLKNSSFVFSEKQVSDSHTIYNFEFSTQPVWDDIKSEK